MLRAAGEVFRRPLADLFALFSTYGATSVGAGELSPLNCSSTGEGAEATRHTFGAHLCVGGTVGAEYTSLAYGAGAAAGTAAVHIAFVAIEDAVTTGGRLAKAVGAAKLIAVGISLAALGLVAAGDALRTAAVDVGFFAVLDAVFTRGPVANPVGTAGEAKTAVRRSVTSLPKGTGQAVAAAIYV